jgi:hypothetical protein
MDDEARTRLRVALIKSDKKAKAISQKFGWPDTYVSRILTGGIISPDPTRLLRICQEVDADIAYILIGETLSSEQQSLLSNVADEPTDVIDQVANFVREIGLGKEQ